MKQKRIHRRNYNTPGHAHELTFCCYRNYKFLDAERTCQWLAESINDARKKYNFLLWSYVFMPVHVHMVIFPADEKYDISIIRKAIKSPVAVKSIRYLSENSPEWIPRITRVRGRKTEKLFWQSGGGYDRNIDNPVTLWKMLEYIHLNPVRRGLVESSNNWKWSSADWYLNHNPSPLQLDPIPVEWAQGNN